MNYTEFLTLAIQPKNSIWLIQKLIIRSFTVHFNYIKTNINININIILQSQSQSSVWSLNQYIHNPM